MLSRKERNMLDESYDWYLEKKKEENPDINIKTDPNIKMTNVIYNYLVDYYYFVAVGFDKFLLMRELLFKEYLRTDYYLRFFMQLELDRNGQTFEDDELISFVEDRYTYLKYTNDFEKYVENYDENRFLTETLLNDASRHVLISLPSEIYFYVKKTYENKNDLELYKKIILNSDEENIFQFLMKIYKEKEKEIVLYNNLLEFLANTSQT